MARKKSLVDVFDSFDKAVDKASDPKMTTKDNPLAEGAQEARATGLFDSNMARLRRDAQMRRNPATGHVYESIMGVRYEGGK